MKIIEIKALEAEQIELLRERSASGDNYAAQVLLEHLRAVSAAICQWAKEQSATDGKTKRKYTLDPNK